MKTRILCVRCNSLYPFFHQSKIFIGVLGRVLLAREVKDSKSVGEKFSELIKALLLIKMALNHIVFANRINIASQHWHVEDKKTV